MPLRTPFAIIPLTALSFDFPGEPLIFIGNRQQRLAARRVAVGLCSIPILARLLPAMLGVEECRPYLVRIDTGPAQPPVPRVAPPALEFAQGFFSG